MTSEQSSAMNPALLHVYAQDGPHDEVYIVGNRDGLGRLLRAIECALKDEKGDCVAMTSDGEHFVAIVLRRDDPLVSDVWQKLVLPYTLEMFADRRNGLDPREVGA